MAGEETNILSRVMKAASRVGARLFRNNCGVLRDKTGRHVRYGVANPGGSDLIGWKTITITPDMIGERLARFTAIEIKTKTGCVSTEQQTFMDAVREAGGIAGVARDEAEALALLNR